MAISEQMQARRDRMLRHVRQMNAGLALVAEITLRPEIAREVCMEVAALVQEAERVFQRATTKDELLTATQAIVAVIRQIADATAEGNWEFPPKPSRMRWKTYWRLKQQYNEVQQRWMAAVREIGN